MSAGEPDGARGSGLAKSESADFTGDIEQFLCDVPDFQPCACDHHNMWIGLDADTGGGVFNDALVVLKGQCQVSDAGHKNRVQQNLF